MQTDRLTDILKDQVQKLDIIHNPDAKQAYQQLQIIQRSIAQDIIYLMDKRNNFDSIKYEKLLANLKIFYQTISLYQKKLDYKEPVTNINSLINRISPNKISYQPLVKQQNQELEEAFSHCDRIKEEIKKYIPQPGWMAYIFKPHTLSDTQAKALADRLIQEQLERGIEL